MYKENKPLYLFVIGIITALSVIAGIFVGTSDILVNSRYGFVVIICAAATAAVCFIVGYRDDRINAAYFKKYTDASEEAEKYKPYLAYTGAGYLYNENVIDQQLDYLKTEIEETIVVLKDVK